MNRVNKKLYFIFFIVISLLFRIDIVNAEECIYQTAVSFPDADIDKTCYQNYNDALNFMNSYESNEREVAIIKKNGKIINAKYAIAKIDVDNEVAITAKGNDGIKTLYKSSYAAYQSVAGNSGADNLTYIASTWGADAAFLDYDNNYNTVRIKISGVDGWIKKSQTIIIPISKYYTATDNYSSHSPLLRANVDAVRLRESADINGKVIDGCNSQTNTQYQYFPSKTKKDNTYTWYYVKCGNSYGWFASDNSKNWFTDVSFLRHDTYYYSFGKELYHRVHKGYWYYDVDIRIGSTPFAYLTKQNKSYLLLDSNSTGLAANNRYQSYDGNYFYNNFKDMIDDYRSGTYGKSVNANYPYYAYFMYLPSRSKTAYTKDQFNQMIINKGYTSFPVNPKSFVNPSTGTFVKGVGNTSMMYGIGQNLINAQDTYGTNALIIYGNAIRESASGRSTIAFYKNNLFGIGATDGNAFNGARTYSTIEEGVNHYASLIGFGSAYSDLNDYRYNGTHEGNKLSGKGVRYASDPYSGESTSSFVYQSDLASGHLDEFSYTVGIKNSNNLVNIYADPSQSSRIIYQTKNYLRNAVLSNLPFVITDYLEVQENGKTQGYYRVYTDVTLNDNRQYDNSKYYNFNTSYGYIKKEDLYVQNKYPEIEATDQIVNYGSDFNYKPKAVDFENGDISSKIVTTGTVDTKTPASYKLTYTVEDNERLKVTKSIIVTVKNSDEPLIHFEDVETPQYISFDQLKGVKAVDTIDGDITSKITVTGNVDTNTKGNYTLTYKVVNSKNLETTRTRTVKVVENERPVITASNKTIYLNETFNSLDGVKANDKEDGDITSKITVTGTVDTSKLGDYQISYKVKDAQNQETVKIITIRVEEKRFVAKENIFHLENLLYNDKTKKFDFTGFIIIKGMNNLPTTDIKYDMIFIEQNSGNEIIKSLSRLTKDIPFEAPSDSGYKNNGSWFRESLDLTDLESGDYTVYIRARSGDFEAKTVLKNLFFNKKVSKKVQIDKKGFSFKSNYYNKLIPLELFVREDGLITTINNPTDDNMYNQVYDLKLEKDKLTLKGTSHNVNGNYAIPQTVLRELYLENIDTKKTIEKYDLGSITSGPYVVTLNVSDSQSKTRVWYEKTIDLANVPKGKYVFQIRTKTGSIDDNGELYDILFKNINTSQTVGDKKYTIVRNNDIRYRLELIVE